MLFRSEQTIQWSTSADFFFIPHFVDQRRTVVSPLKIQDHEYLGDPPPREDFEGVLQSDDTKLEPSQNARPNSEKQKRTVQRMRGYGENRL